MFTIWLIIIGLIFGFFYIVPIQFIIGGIIAFFVLRDVFRLCKRMCFAIALDVVRLCKRMYTAIEYNIIRDIIRDAVFIPVICLILFIAMACYIPIGIKYIIWVIPSLILLVYVFQLCKCLYIAIVRSLVFLKGNTIGLFR